MALDSSLFIKVVQKGYHPDFDSYSGFKDDNGASTGLENFLKKLGIKYVFVLGLATDYCVQSTAKDAAEAGFTTYLVEDLSHGVNSQEAPKIIRALQNVAIIQSKDPIFQHILGAQVAAPEKKQSVGAKGRQKARVGVVPVTYSSAAVPAA